MWAAEATGDWEIADVKVIVEVVKAIALTVVLVQVALASRRLSRSGGTPSRRRGPWRVRGLTRVRDRGDAVEGVEAGRGKPRREEGNNKICVEGTSGFGSARTRSGPIQACEQPLGYVQQGNPKGETKVLFAYRYSV
jgi:hypothetical protein